MQPKDHHLILLSLQSNQGVLTKKTCVGEIRKEKEKDFLPLHSRGKFSILSGSYSNIWLMLQETPGFSLTKPCPLPAAQKISLFLENPHPVPKPPKANHPVGQNCTRHMAKKKPSTDLLKQKTQCIRGVWKEPHLDHPFAAFGFPFPSIQVGWNGVKIKRAPFPTPWKSQVLQEVMNIGLPTE